MRKAALIVAQISVLAVICKIGYLCTAGLRLSVPGNLLGMLLLLVLLAGGVVKLEWIEAGATLLLTHLAFFFVPIAVGLMNFGELLERHGIALLATLVAAAAAGIVLAGFVTQTLAKRSTTAVLRIEA
jgi:holin-like protein